MSLLKKKIKCTNSGFTLVELVVAVAILSILSVFLVFTYTNTMENQRKQSDMVKMHHIDTTINHLLLKEDVFNEFQMLYNDSSTKDLFTDGLKLMFTLRMNTSTEESSIKLTTDSDECNIYLSYDDGQKLVNMKNCLPNTYKYLVQSIGKEIKLESNSYKKGRYIVTIDFDIIQLNEYRDAVISNDSYIISNSGTKYISGKYGK